jgi:hypothetical protein
MGMNSGPDGNTGSGDVPDIRGNHVGHPSDPGDRITKLEPTVLSILGGITLGPLGGFVVEPVEDTAEADTSTTAREVIVVGDEMGWMVAGAAAYANEYPDSLENPFIAMIRHAQDGQDPVDTPLK